MTIAARLEDWARHIVCLLALMWLPLANGQPFFFNDTTNYIRAADIALHLASGKTISTVWTERYEASLPDPKVGHLGPGTIVPATATHSTVTHNDISAGLIMSGRSPYIGALMYLGYLTSNFWLYVLFQAGVSYFLITLALRRFGIDSKGMIVATVFALSAFTTLPFFNGLLLADSFGAFAIIAFLLLATPGKLSRPEIAALLGVLVISVSAHLTHIVMLAAMLATVALLLVLRWRPPAPRRAWLAGIAGIVVGFASVQLTAFATEAALGKKPQLLPLLTARFIADGPGKAFIDAGCDGQRFQICRIRIGDASNATWILSSTDRATGTYLFANPEERRLLGAEDGAFAWAVFKFDPVGQTGMIIRNTFRQLLWIEYTGLNVGCFEAPYCWDSLPTTVREALKRTPSGQNAWPEGAFTVVLRAATAVSFMVLLIGMWNLARTSRDEFTVVRLWVLVTLAAMLASAAFGGAGVEPQHRYQGRLIWLLPFYAIIVVGLVRRARRAAPEAATASQAPLTGMA